MKYYMVVNCTPTDEAWIAKYLGPVTDLVHKHGGKYLVRTGNMERIEGDRPLPSVAVIVEWPSKKAAEAFYNDPKYAPFLQMRLAGAENDTILVAGEDIAAG